MRQTFSMIAIAVASAGLILTACSDDETSEEPFGGDKDVQTGKKDTNSTSDTEKSNDSTSSTQDTASGDETVQKDTSQEETTAPDDTRDKPDSGSSCSNPNPANTPSCGPNDDCPADTTCDPSTCTPSSCSCRDGRWVCTEDCRPTCIPEGEEPTCNESNPAEVATCEGSKECPVDFSCDQSICTPSSCECTNEGWACTDDCLPTCTKDSDGGGGDNDCMGPDPSGCDSDSDCPGDQVCKDDPNSCTPSSCSCSGSGGWMCTSDCGGTVCMDP